MTKHSVTMKVDTDDAKSLRMIVSLSRDVVKRKKDENKDTGMAHFMRPIIKQLLSLSRRMDDALLDRDTPLGKVKEDRE